MDYQFISIIATILLASTSIVSLNISAIRGASRATNQRIATLEERVDERFIRVDKHLDKMDERLNKMDRRIDKVDERLDKVDERLNKLDVRLDKVDERLNKLDVRLDKMGAHLNKADERFLDIQKEFTTVHAGIARLEGLIEGSRGTLATTLAGEVERRV